MAKVSLRIYNREIESLIDQGHINEAIAHCHHILRTFPKHLATYRLIGKAYLETKRYADAVDIFSRVLMAVPDDFVSHVGMSIIRDEEKKMDDAIWHMERAFETQPSNAAIQGELQRLYGRRDGMEPPKVRMTRGALAHMYVQGELYPQAVAEIRAVLAEDAERADMQVLLARAFFRGGQKADASDMCAQLLKRYQYCFDANRIMVDLLPATAGVAESTQVYRMRVGELDPYATFAKGSVFLSDEVADAAINLEKLDYKEENEPSAQSWTPSLGLGSGAAAAPALSAINSMEPDWLTGNATPPASTPAAQANEEIPDFLRQAGWGTSSSPEQPTSMFDEESAGDLTPADIPDWLKGQEPVAAATPAPTPQPEPAQSFEVPDWLMDNTQSAQTGDIPDWLKEASQTPVEPTPMDATASWLSELDKKDAEAANLTEPLDNKVAEPVQAASDIPDWLSGLDEKSVESANVPDWLSGLDDKSAEPLQMDATTSWLNELDNKPVEPSQSESDIPDWLSGVDNKSAESAGIPDWLSGLDEKSTEPANIPDWLSGTDNQQAAESANIPDWLSGLDAEEKPAPAAPAVESLGASAQEQDDAVAWLESLAAKHGAKPEELVTDPNKRSETPPEWVSQAQNLNQETPAPQTPVASVESLGASTQEQDDAVAWLESLAAKHGAKPEELVTDPNKRSETPPEWVSQAQSIGEAQSAPQVEQKPEVVENALNIGEQFFAEFETASVAPPMDATAAWLKNLSDEEEKAEKLAQEFTVSNEIPDWLNDTPLEPVSGQAQDAGIPEWLSEAQPDEAAPAEEQFPFTQQEPEPDAKKSALPNWLSDMEKDTEPQAASQDMSEGDLANWLNSLDDEPGLPFESMPTPDSILFDSQVKPASKSKGAEATQDQLGLPEWLSNVDKTEEAEVEWKAPEVKQAEGLPEWLQETAEEEESAYSGDDTPPWQQRERWEAEEEPQHPTPTSPSDWHPLETTQQTEEKPAPKKEPVVEAPKPFVPPPPLPVTAAVQTPAPTPQPAEIVNKKKAGLPARKPQTEGANVVAALNQAKGELDRGDIPAALAHYGKLIKKGKHIEETIRDLTESIYRYPVEVGIWQTLGDAYMRANRLKEALEAYNKAEELIR